MVHHRWPLGFTFIILLPVVLLFASELFQTLRERCHTPVSHIFSCLCGLFVIPLCKLAFSHLLGTRSEVLESSGSRNSVYGVDHGRLHLTLPLPMWMNMGYWHGINDSYHGDEACSVVRNLDSKRTLATASRALLCEVLKTAGFDGEGQTEEGLPSTIPSSCLIDLGVGCGDQTVYLMSPLTIRRSDELWWDYKSYRPRFKSYTGLTLHQGHFHYAQERVRELHNTIFTSQIDQEHQEGMRNTKLFCVDAARPDKWNDELNKHIHTSVSTADESWVLALDTLYHFSPSRWPVITYASNSLKSSFMAFDLCLAEHVSFPQLILLRMLTLLMSAPWANFVTQDEYRKKLIEAGYRDITMKDITEHVFAPLNTFLEDQDRTLKIIGHGLGPFHAARWMFRWWARTGIVRGVIVVARR